MADPSTLRRDLRAMLGDGVAFSAMVGIGETYLPAFALAVGMGVVSAGLVATLPVLAGALLQLVTPWGVRRLRSYRRWVVLCARLQAASFLPLVAGALLGRIRPEWLFLSAAAYWGFGMATGPAWNSWVGALVPEPMRARFFANRTRWSQGALFAAVLSGGAILERGHGAGAALPAFATLFGLALASRLVSSAFLASQSEPDGLAQSHRSLSFGEVLARLRGTEAGGLLVYLLATQVSVNVAAPYFTPFMLKHLELSYAEFTALTGAAFLSRIAVLPGLARLAEGRGSRVLLWMGAAGIVPLPLFWLVSDALVYLLVLQLVAGAAWAAMELATLLSFFEVLDARDRTSVLTVFNVANTFAMALGALLGAGLFTIGAPGIAPYAAIFAASVAGRFASLGLLRRAHVHPVPVHPPISLRTLAVRPSLGAIQRPILPTLEGEKAGEDDRR
jgi:hypothetical protein